MKTQHTPGPWQAVQVKTHCELGAFAPPAHYQIQAELSPIGATLVCELRPYGKDNDANARLIAAAPELLAALETMLCADNAICENIGLKSDQAMQRIAAIDYAREVITKAKGAK